MCVGLDMDYGDAQNIALDEEDNLDSDAIDIHTLDVHSDTSLGRSSDNEEFYDCLSPQSILEYSESWLTKVEERSTIFDVNTISSSSESSTPLEIEIYQTVKKARKNHCTFLFM